MTLKTLCKQTAAAMLSILLIFAAGACSESGTTGEINPPPGPIDPNPPAYSYGEDWTDEYDEAYTRSLLAGGEQEFTISQLAGTDGLGRAQKTTAGRAAGKYVGMFYFLWHNDTNQVYDISKLLEANPDLKYDTVKNPLWALSGSSYYNTSVSPEIAFHYFEEPLFGYYTSTDRWVIKRHLEMLAYAGIDFLYLDFTNAGYSHKTYGKGEAFNIYPEATYALMDCILEMQALGYNVPKIVPMVCNPDTNGGTVRRSHVVEWVYDHYYAYENFKYRDCWFTADATRNPSGKPLLVSYTIDRNEFMNPSAYDAFWYRNVVWPTQVNENSYANGFPWMDYELPQANYGGVKNVSVAQHISGAWSSEAYLAREKRMFEYAYRGRSAVGAQKYAYQTDSEEEAAYGNNFAEQWENVLASEDAWMITVTGWNEWVAQKLNLNGQYATFVDTFNTAFSRDLEMMRDAGGYSDNYYMQLASYVRRFKSVSSSRHSDTAMWKRQTVRFDEISSWDTVQAKYIDFVSDATARNCASVGNAYTYTDDSARNDIAYLKIANDSEYLYILVHAQNQITDYEAGDECWMNLDLSTGAPVGWEGYNFVINRRPENGKTSIEKLGVNESGKITVQTLTNRADYFVSGHDISYRIPLSALEVTSANEIQIKACDNIFANRRTDRNDGVGVYEFGNAMAFYCGGDSAPVGRLNYAYRMGY